MASPCGGTTPAVYLTKHLWLAWVWAWGGDVLTGDGQQVALDAAPGYWPAAGGTPPGWRPEPAAPRITHPKPVSKET